MLPQEMFSFQIASEAILGQKQAVVATWLAEYCFKFLAGPCMHSLSQLHDIKFVRKKVLRLAKRQVG